jgi:2',3'-cyclic-nucleotide 2'-phosphodiesterase (5'-nucleotidase family)
MPALLSRRRALVLGAGAALGPTVSAPLVAATRPDLVVVILSDLHSAYSRMTGTLAAVDRVIRSAAGAPVLVVINGDVFERGNVVALRSQGAADWAFLEALRRRAPVVLNLGNHETALLDDMAETVRAARARGILVVSNMIDRRTGRPYAAAHEVVSIGGVEIDVVGIATDEMNTYRQVAREHIEVPAPGAWGRERLPTLLRSGRLAVVLSHAGVAADREMLPVIPDGSLLVGGHEHLHFRHEVGRTRYLHVGSWNRFVTSALVTAPGAANGRIDVERADIPLNADAEPALAASIREQTARHLTDEDRQVIVRPRRALSLGESGRRLAAAMARAADADVGVISHTTLGTGIEPGDVTRFDMASVIRFDGGVVVAEIAPETLRGILRRANQDDDRPLADRSGDFVYANTVEVRDDRRYRLVANGWTRLNAARLLGVTGLEFTEARTPTLRAMLAAALD